MRIGIYNQDGNIVRRGQQGGIGAQCCGFGTQDRLHIAHGKSLLAAGFGAHRKHAVAGG
jgi:hypothetical protein